SSPTGGTASTPFGTGVFPPTPDDVSLALVSLALPCRTSARADGGKSCRQAMKRLSEFAWLHDLKISVKSAERSRKGSPGPGARFITAAVRPEIFDGAVPRERKNVSCRQVQDHRAHAGPRVRRLGSLESSGHKVVDIFARN